MIGVFDSGVGGLTVVKEIFKNLPQYQLIYFGDTARLPYGTRGADFVIKYSKKITEWLLKRGAKIIIVACNTASAWASDSLKKEFPGVPIFEMITPAVDSIIGMKRKKVGIIGTAGTIRSGVYIKKLHELDGSLQLISQSCPLFVPLVEEGWIDDKITKEAIKRYLGGLKGIDSLVLGCTHYPMLEGVIQKILGKKVKIINPAKILGKELKDFLKDNPEIESKIKRGSNHKFYFSSEPYNFEKISSLCFNKRIKPIIEDPFSK